MTDPNQHTDTETPHGSRDRVTFPDTVKTTFNLHIESIDETCSIVNHIGRALVKKMALMQLRTQISMSFDFFKHPVYPHGRKEDLTVRLELKSSGKVIFCSRYTAYDFVSKNEEIYNPNIKKVSTIINRMPH